MGLKLSRLKKEESSAADLSWVDRYLDEHRETIGSLKSNIELKIQEEAVIIANEKRYRMLVHNTPDTVLIVDRSGVILFSNHDLPRCKECTRLKVCAGGLLQDHLCVGDTEAIFQAMELAFNDTQIKIVEYVCPGEAYIRARFVRNGSPDRLMVILEDETERKAVERAIKEKKTQLEELFNNVPALIFFKDLQNNILRANRYFEKAMGVEPGGLDGRNCEEIWPGLGAKYLVDDLEVAASQKPKLGVVETFIPRSGSFEERLCVTNKIPVFNEEGNTVIGILGLTSDITDPDTKRDQMV